MKKVLVILLSLSLLLNAVLVAGVLYQALMGCAEIADGKLGVLTRNIEVGQFNKSDTIFSLPKGLIVRDASATGADWFEPYRFRLVVTTDDKSLVNYDEGIVPESGHHHEYYSADVTLRRNLEVK